MSGLELFAQIQLIVIVALMVFVGVIGVVGILIANNESDRYIEKRLKYIRKHANHN